MWKESAPVLVCTEPPRQLQPGVRDWHTREGGGGDHAGSLKPSTVFYVWRWSPWFWSIFCFKNPETWWLLEQNDVCEEMWQLRFFRLEWVLHRKLGPSMKDYCLLLRRHGADIVLVHQHGWRMFHRFLTLVFLCVDSFLSSLCTCLTACGSSEAVDKIQGCFFLIRAFWLSWDSQWWSSEAAWRGDLRRILLRCCSSDIFYEDYVEFSSMRTQMAS